MELKREFYGNKDEAFKLIMDGLISDIKHETGEVMELESIEEGFTYLKKLKNKFGHEGSVKVTIAKMDIPNYYEAHFDSQQGLNILSYELITKDEEAFDLIYRESFNSEKASRNLNFSLMSFLFKRSSKKRINLMLDQLQVLLNQ